MRCTCSHGDSSKGSPPIWRDGLYVHRILEAASICHLQLTTASVQLPGEVRAAASVCEALGIDHLVITADIAALGSGDMAGKEPSREAPASEWWPYRNQFLVTLAAMKCHELQVSELMIGALRTDGFHVDSTPEFYIGLNRLF